MVIFLNLDGSCENVSPQRVFQGSNNVTDITVVAPYANSTAMQIGFILPNGLYWQNETDGARYMPMEFIKQDVTTKANVWRYTLQGAVTEQVGELYIAINALTNDGNTTSYMIRQDIEESVLPNLPSAPEPSVYELLQLYISRLDGRTANVPNLVASIQKVKGASNAFTYTDNSGVESAPIVIGGGEDVPVSQSTASTVSIPASAWQPVYAADGTTVTGYTYTITASMHGQMRDQTQAKNLWVSFDEVAGTEYNPDYTGVFAEYKVNNVGDITISVSQPVAMSVRVWNGKGLRGETGNNGQDGASIVGVRTIGSEVIAPGTQTRTYLVPVIKQGVQTWDGEQFYVTVKNGEDGNAIRYIQQGRTETVGSMTRTYFTVVYTKSAREEFYVDAAMGTPGRDGRNGRGVMNLRVTGVSESDGYTVNTVRQDFTDGSHYDMEIKAKNGEDVEARAAIAAETERAEDVENQIKEKISGIESVIPTTATEENKLADQAFVNSSINNMAAFYITSNAQGDAFPTRESLLIAQTYYYGGEPRVPTQNDYAIVIADESQPKGANDSYPTTRYSYQGTGWSFQYVVNNTSLTQAQVNAINSGITKELVDQIGKGNVTGVKGNAESTYRTGNVNLTPANIGSVNKAGDTMTGPLEITGTNPGGWSLKASGDVGGDRLYEGDVRVYSPNNPPPSGNVSSATPTSLGTIYGDTLLGSNQTASVGYNARTGSYNNATAFGFNTRCFGNNGTALGHDAYVSGNNCTAVGHKANAVSTYGYGTSIGAIASTQSYGTALGYNAKTFSSYSTALGCNSNAYGSHAVAIGYQAQCPGVQSIAIGEGANAAGSSIAIGYYATATTENTIVLGNLGITSLRCAVQTITSLSDERTKEDISFANIAQCLADVERLPVKRFKFKKWARRSPRDIHRTGFIAQDVEKVFPKDVETDPESFPVLDENDNPVMENELDENGNIVYEDLFDENGKLIIKSETTDENGHPLIIYKQKPKLKQKEFRIEDCKKISMADGLPTLWGAVQYLSQQLKETRAELEKVKVGVKYKEENIEA